eukprot:5165169-Amphidinium_carterae.3
MTLSSSCETRHVLLVYPSIAILSSSRTAVSRRPYHADVLREEFAPYDISSHTASTESRQI